MMSALNLQSANGGIIMKKLNDNSGFSLVEVIVVVAIMIVLISMLLPNVLGYAD